MPISSKKSVFGSLLLGLLVSANAPIAGAATGDGTTAFDWQATKGSWMYAWGRLPNEKIDQVRHFVKDSIGSTFSPDVCGTGSKNFGLVGAYATDFNKDGLTDHVIDATPYVQETGYNFNCPADLYRNVDGIGKVFKVAFFITVPPEQIKFSVTGTTTTTTTTTSVSVSSSATTSTTSSTSSTTATQPEACPAKAADNTECRPDCDALPDICPNLFRYPSILGMARFAYSWKVLTPSSYASMVGGITGDRSSGVPMYATNAKMYPFYTDRPIVMMDTSRSDGTCTEEELMVWGGKCMKFYQYEADNMFHDLFYPDTGNGDKDVENDPRMTKTMFDRPTAYVGKDWTKADNSDSRLKLLRNGGKMAFQFMPTNTELECWEFTNTSNQDFFIPSHADNDYEEPLAFKKQVIEDKKIPGVTGGVCSKKYTPWYPATLSCPPLSCGQVMQIGYQRRCQRSTSAYGLCGECQKWGAADTQADTFGHIHQCNFVLTCVGDPCPPPGPDCICFGEKTKIAMADGSTKAIVKVKIGDKIKGFDKKDPKGVLREATVKWVRRTVDAMPIQINNVKVTPSHTLVLESGSIVPASAVKVGDKLIDASGNVVEVKKVKTPGQKSTVYNLGLEGADGYIADGIRAVADPGDSELKNDQAKDTP